MIHVTPYEAQIYAIRPGVDRLTAANAAAFKAQVIAQIDGGASQVIIDFQQVAFVDSSGLGALVGVLKKMGHKGELMIAGLHRDVAQMFHICRMDSVFAIYPDVATAVQSMDAQL